MEGHDREEPTGDQIKLWFERVMRGSVQGAISSPAAPSNPKPRPNKDALKAWIQSILDRKDWTATELARHAELAASTVCRLMNDEHHKFTPSMTTLRKIAKAAGEAVPLWVLNPK